MRHIFSSGEIHYKKNLKNLSEGPYLAESIEYETIDADTEYISIGTINEKAVKVCFRIEAEDFEMIQYKKHIHILMQSDIFLSQWALYRIEALEN